MTRKLVDFFKFVWPFQNVWTLPTLLFQDFANIGWDIWLVKVGQNRAKFNFVAIFCLWPCMNIFFVKKGLDTH